MKKAVIYARYSCDKQNYQSIEGQVRVCSKFAKDNNFKIVNTYIDQATTGTNDKRFAFQKMLIDSASKSFDTVIIYKNDRFARNRIESAINKKTLKDNGVKVVSATENIPDSPEGIILESLLEGMAEYYSVELSQKVKRGMTELFLKKQFTGGAIPFGYDIVDKKYQINDYEANIVKKIFEDYANGISKSSIIDNLNKMGVVNKQNKPISYSSLDRMLKNTKYIGIIIHDNVVYDNIVPAIIDKELFERVNNKTAYNKRKRTTDKSFYILSGKLYCGQCNSLMQGDCGTSKNGNLYHYYTCYNHKKTKSCTLPSINKDLLENKIFEICAEILKKEYITEVVDHAYNIYIDDIKSNNILINLNNQLDLKKKAINNILIAIEQGIITASTQDRLLQLEQDIAIINDKINQEKLKFSSLLTKQDYFDFLNNFVDKQIDNNYFKSELINLLIKKIVLYPNKLKIVFNYTKSQDFPTSTSDLYEEATEDTQKKLVEQKCSTNSRMVTRGRIELPIQP